LGKELYAVDGDGLHLYLNEAQQAVERSKKRFVCLFAGTQGGKTSYAPWWLFDRIKESCKTDELNDYIVVTATYPLMNLKLLPAFIEVYEDVLDIGRLNKSEKVIYFEYGGAKGRIIFCSAENPESMESATAKAAVLDECGQVQFRGAAWEAVRRRLSLYRGRVLLITTLYSGGGWLKTDFYDHWKKEQENPGCDPIGQDIDIFQFPSTVNPKFSLEEFESARQSMPEWKFKMLYQGQFANPVGLVYDAFHTETNLIKRFRIPDEWGRYCGMDFGNDTCAIFFAVDPATGFIYAYREYYAMGKSTLQHADDLKSLSSGETIRKCTGGAPGDEGWRGDFTKAGWRVSQPTVKHVEQGIDRCYAFMKTGKLFIFSDLYQLVDEISTYSYRVDDTGHPTQDIANKQRYHGCDSMRYILSEFNISANNRGDVKVWRC
jgi:hypothetical protein